MNPVSRRILTALMAAALVVWAVLSVPVGWIAPVVNVLTALAVLEFALLLRRKVPLLSRQGIFGLVVGFLMLSCGLSALSAAAVGKGSWALLYLIAVVKLSDMGGFAFGLSSARLMKGGNHKMCPSISPNKSWEGLLGSVLGSVLLSLAFLPVMHFAWPKAVVLGIVAALVGTFGDLVESKFKRWVGVKDSATFMPAGLGGLLDMLDSLIFAPAVLLPYI